MKNLGPLFCNFAIQSLETP